MSNKVASHRSATRALTGKKNERGYLRHAVNPRLHRRELRLQKLLEDYGRPGRFRSDIVGTSLCRDLQQLCETIWVWNYKYCVASSKLKIFVLFRGSIPGVYGTNFRLINSKPREFVMEKRYVPNCRKVHIHASPALPRVDRVPCYSLARTPPPARQTKMLWYI